MEAMAKLGFGHNIEEKIRLELITYYNFSSLSYSDSELSSYVKYIIKNCMHVYNQLGIVGVMSYLYESPRCLEPKANIRSQMTSFTREEFNQVVKQLYAGIPDSAQDEYLQVVLHLSISELMNLVIEEFPHLWNSDQDEPLNNKLVELIQKLDLGSIKGKNVLEIIAELNEKISNSEL